MCVYYRNADMTDFIKQKVADAISLTVTDTGKTMAERITDEACSLLASKIDDVVTKITNGTLSKLQEKIDSEEFSENFMNVLQEKVIDAVEKYKTKPSAQDNGVKSVMSESVLSDTNVPVSLVPGEQSVPLSPVPSEQSVSPSPDATTPAPKMGGYRSKRTRKVSRISKSRRNRRNQPKVLTKRNLFL